MKSRWIFFVLLLCSWFSVAGQVDLDSTVCLPLKQVRVAIMANEKLKLVEKELLVARTGNLILLNRIRIKDLTIGEYKVKDSLSNIKIINLQVQNSSINHKYSISKMEVEQLYIDIKKEKKKMWIVGGVSIISVIASLIFK